MAKRAIVHRGLVVGSAGNSIANLTATLPTYVAPGDFMLAVVSSSNATITAPGWTRLLGGTSFAPDMSVGAQGIAVLYKFATESDRGAVASFSQGGNTGYGQSLIIHIYEGVDATDPIDDFASASHPANSPAVGSHTPGNLTQDLAAASRAFYAVYQHGNGTGAPSLPASGFTSLHSGGVAGTDARSSIGYRHAYKTVDPTSPGAVASGQFTGQNAGWTSMALLLRPADDTARVAHPVGAAAAAVTAASSTNPLLTYPTGTKPGDIAVLMHMGTQQYGAIAAGWDDLLYSLPGTRKFSASWHVVGAETGVAAGTQALQAAATGLWMVAVFRGTGVAAQQDLIFGPSIDRQYGTGEEEPLGGTLNTKSIAGVPTKSVVCHIFAGGSTSTAAVASGTWSSPAAGVQELFDFGTGSSGNTAALHYEVAPSTGATTSRSATHTGTPTGGMTAITLTLRSSNAPPLAATGLSPSDGTVIDRAVTNRFSWMFADPNSGDVQLRYDIRYKPVNDATWTVVSDVTASTFRDFAADTFALGDYEWQVLTYDALDTVGVWSPSAFFTVDNRPAPPVIDTPVEGETITVADYALTWTHATQEAYQYRKVADGQAGAADPAVIYVDSGTIATSGARERPISFPVNNRYEHVQLRVRVNGLWSDWESQRILVDYVPPDVPTFTVAQEPLTGSLLITINNPNTGPAVAYNEVWIDEGDGEKRYATNVGVDGTWRFHVPLSEREISVRVKAVAGNGTSSWSV